MRTRADRKQDFDTIKHNLFDAGTSVLNVAQTSEDLFTSSVRALAAAIDPEPETPPPNTTKSVRQLIQELQRRAKLASDIDGYLDATQKLQMLEEFELSRLERKAHRLDLELRIRAAQVQLAQLKTVTIRAASAIDPQCLAGSDQLALEDLQLPPGRDSWTETTLKHQYKTLSALRQAFDISAKTWKEAVEQVNQAVATEADEH